MRVHHQHPGAFLERLPSQMPIKLVALPHALRRSAATRRVKLIVSERNPLTNNSLPVTRVSPHDARDDDNKSAEHAGEASAASHACRGTGDASRSGLVDGRIARRCSVRAPSFNAGRAHYDCAQRAIQFPPDRPTGLGLKSLRVNQDKV